MMTSKTLYTPKRPLYYLGNYIHGEFHIPSDLNGEWTLKSPADLNDEIAKIKYSFVDIDRAVQSAKTAHRSWRNTTQDERSRFLLRYQESLNAHEEEWIEIISRETGKPFWESKTEFSAMVNKVNITINESLNYIKEMVLPEVLPHTVGRNQYRSLGVMAVIGPFNFPGHLPNGHIVPALLTGNTVVFKPSEKTPLSGQLMAQCFHEAQLPQGVFNLIQGEKETGRRLSTHDGVHGVLFTGSYEVGTRIKQDTLTQHWKLLALEMGGKNSTLVWEDAQIDHAVYETLVSAFITAGQRCSSTSRVIVHEKVIDSFVHKLHHLTKSFKIGHPSETPFMGPLIDSTSVDRFLKFQPIAQREGFEPIMRGKALELSTPGHYVTPSLYLQKNPSLESVQKSIYQQTEIFSPHLAILSVSSLEKAITLSNATQYGLVTSVFTKSREVFEACYQDLETGLINWNKGTVGASSRLPFGGTKKSGNHQPTALTSVLYCTYPVASLESELSVLPDKKLPGLS